MGISPAVVTPQKALEDPLAYLPCSTIVEYKKGQMIYNQDQPSTSIYLVIDGKVKVCRLADDGHQVVVDIYQTDEFFGESAFLNLPHRAEQATALENTKLMTWTRTKLKTSLCVARAWRSRCFKSWSSAQSTSDIGSRAFRWTISLGGWRVH